jgi:hypothetical protein
MIQSIREEFLQILKESEWMDKESKALALAKVKNSFFKILAQNK